MALSTNIRMDIHSLNQAITISNESGQQMGFLLKRISDTSYLVTLDQELAYFTEYLISIDTQAMSYNGSFLGETYEASFKTIFRDLTKPIIDTFQISPSGVVTSPNVAVTLTASDENGIKGYLITENPILPNAVTVQDNPSPTSYLLTVEKSIHYMLGLSMIT